MTKVCYGALDVLAKVLVFVFIGGLIACLHQDENSSFNLFKLDIMAPAFISTMMNGLNITLTHKNIIPPVNGTITLERIASLQSEFTKHKSIGLLLIKPAYVAGEEQLKSFSRDLATQRFWRGNTGSVTKKRYFVITDSVFYLWSSCR